VSEWHLARGTAEVVCRTVPPVPVQRPSAAAYKLY
jgi:hypothetical protein